MTSHATEKFLQTAETVLENPNTTTCFFTSNTSWVAATVAKFVDGTTEDYVDCSQLF